MPVKGGISTLVSSAIVDHWRGKDPAWVKSLVSSLYRSPQSDFEPPTVPLTMVVEDILQWLQLGSCEAWKKKSNRTSLRWDLDHSVEVLGEVLRETISTELTNFLTSMKTLMESGNGVFAPQPQERTTATHWTDAVDSARALLVALGSRHAGAASFDDLVTIAKCRKSAADREFRPISDLLFTQIEQRGYDAEVIFRDLIRLVSTGEIYWTNADPPQLTLEARVSKARELASSEPDFAPTVVWLGYQGRIFPRWNTARVSFISALWAVPNAAPSGQDFDNKSELWKITKDGHHFSVPTYADEEADVELLVRVDLGMTTPAMAVNRAAKIAESIFDTVIGLSGGLYPELRENVVLRAGEVSAHGVHMASAELNVKNDPRGLHMTEQALDKFGPEIADAMAREELPLFISAALDAQVTANKPFSRGKLAHTPSEIDIENVVLLGARAVEHVVAEASMKPHDLFRALKEQWPHTRWLDDIKRAVGFCLDGFALNTIDPNEGLRRVLINEWHNKEQHKHWSHFIAARREQLLALCPREAECAWVEKILLSVSDHNTYMTIIKGYQAESELLESRRARVRNALTHGNPTSAVIVRSVSNFSSFLSQTAVATALEAFINKTDLAEGLLRRPDDFSAMLSGQDAVSYWVDNRQ